MLVPLQSNGANMRTAASLKAIVTAQQPTVIQLIC